MTASEINNAFTVLNQNISTQINTAVENQMGSAPNYSSRIQDLYTRDSTQQTQIDSLVQQFSNFNDLSARMLAAEKTITAQGATISQPSSTISNHSMRLNENETQISSLQTKTTTTAAVVGNHGQLVNSQGQKIDAQGQQINGLETRAATTEEVVANLGTTVANQGTTLAEHENRIIANETNIANLGTTVASQGTTIAKHENRIIANEADIATIKDTGVTYNVGLDGKKSGGLTFNEGTGSPVLLSNVGAGKAATDAVNVSQLSSAVGALGGGSQIAADGSLIGPTYAVAGKNYNNVGDALKATNEAGVQYVVDGNGKATNVIVLRGSGSGPVRMQSVANGLVSSDAANLGQVNKARQDAISYTDQRMTEISHSSNEQFSQLGGEIASTKREMRAGVSGAIAMAAMRYDNQPGKVTITGGFGSFGGMQSVSAGLGFVSQDGRWRMNAGISQNFGSETNVGVNMGVSYTLN
ncbi:hypothetical protein RU07_21915 [Agrobacterium tumefaciens]|uniref:Trimeric autotransporter adhesin YadA-like C-terminal membrane anchor domain-containing protein n=1 Tax=Agrobacterium tumefaciens TaxID=358 RepID=A0A0D0IZY2_AGRTU|nr:hypothetical protein RU07_21915 [Agrobacterium tumefaciens]